MADESSSQAWNVKISLRLKTANNELIVLHEVDVLIVLDGECILLGSNILSVFKKTVTQNKLMELIYAYNTKACGTAGIDRFQRFSTLKFKCIFHKLFKSPLKTP